MKHWALMMILFSIPIGNVHAKKNPIEIGAVQWGRNYEDALSQSSKTGKPILLLFQEVPGCSGCRNFGKTVLSSPLLVEAIESEFVPVVIYNNRGGVDKKILDLFKEPSWNFQVVRFLNDKGQDLIPRKDKVWTVHGIASRMIESLKVAKRQVPTYLKLVAVENDTNNHAVAAFEMHCFWTGEMKLGRIDGIISTEAGWLEGREVTKVIYDKTKLGFDELVGKARNAKVANKVYVQEGEVNIFKNLLSRESGKVYHKAKRADQKKQLERRAAIRRLTYLTEMQKTKLNAFAPIARAEALKWLSPRQRMALKK